jgi:multisubunit Na+/H+ antiporter MnhG subunit
MGLDIRFPIGILFSLFGALLAGFGLMSDKGIYARSLGMNVNLGWGLVLLVFGLVMLTLGRKTSRKRPADTAAREHATQQVGSGSAR